MTGPKLLEVTMIGSSTLLATQGSSQVGQLSEEVAVLFALDVTCSVRLRIWT